VAGAAGQARADLLLGDSVQAEYYFPTSLSTYENDGTKIINPTASFFSSPGSITSIVSDHQIVISFPGDVSYTPGSFNGLTFTDVSRDPGITGVTLQSSTPSQFDISRVTFTSRSVSFNWQNLQFQSGSTITLDLQSGVAAVPEPSTLISCGMAGLLGVGYGWRRRKTKLAA
jgi:hypothetical protein